MARFTTGNGSEAQDARFDAGQEPINDDAVTLLAEPWRAIAFSDGSMYRVPRVPYDIGRRLSRINRTIAVVAEAADEAADAGREWQEPPEYWDVLNEIRRLCRGYLEPIGKRAILRRILWRVGLHDPLAKRSEGELATVAGFFQRLRMSRANPLP